MGIIEPKDLLAQTLDISQIFATILEVKGISPAHGETALIFTLLTSMKARCPDASPEEVAHLLYKQTLTLWGQIL